MRLESEFQPRFIKRLKQEFPGCMLLKNDTSYRQGMPDLILLWRKHWAIFEVKRKKPTRPEDFEPNQEWYIEKMNQMSYAACVYPENEEVVISEIQSAFGLRRNARVSKR